MCYKFTTPTRCEVCCVCVCVCEWVHVLVMYNVRMYMCSVMFLLCMAASVDSRHNIST